jgi:hypothetical protein
MRPRRWSRTWPCPVGTVVENPRSTTVCQNVTPGYHDMSGDRSGPRGSSSQAGARYNSCGFHHTTGSEEFCRYITLGTSGGSLGDRSSGHTGVPVSRSSTSSRQIGFANGGPTSRVPWAPAAMLSRSPKVVSVP